VCWLQMYYPRISYVSCVLANIITQVFLLSSEIWQKLRLQILYNGFPDFLGNNIFNVLMHTHSCELIKSAGNMSCCCYWWWRWSSDILWVTTFIRLMTTLIVSKMLLWRFLCNFINIYLWSWFGFYWHKRDSCRTNYCPRTTIGMLDNYSVEPL
jgi:hypothetical protein